MAATAVICFQAADIYQVQVFRGQSAPDDPDDLVLGVRVPAVHRRLLHRQARQRNFAALAYGVFLHRPCGAGRPGGCSCARWCAAGPVRAGSTAAPSSSARTRTANSWSEALKVQDDSDIKVLGVFDDRNDDRAHGHLRRQPEARQGRRHRRIRAPHPHRPRAVRAADLGRDAHSRNAEEAVGAAGRHPPFGPHQQAALPSPLLFLSRRGADARRVRGADHRLGPGDEMAVRPRRRLR